MPRHGDYPQQQGQGNHSPAPHFTDTLSLSIVPGQGFTVTNQVDDGQQTNLVGLSMVGNTEVVIFIGDEATVEFAFAVALDGAPDSSHAAGIMRRASPPPTILSSPEFVASATFASHPVRNSGLHYHNRCRAARASQLEARRRREANQRGEVPPIEPSTAMRKRPQSPQSGGQLEFHPTRCNRCRAPYRSVGRA
ncbi:hypothetical protein B0I35DRAFT_410608 [Stachybotrys elegans]|uniref:Uncharacterized protein n=1 Tax=Stachybotrys elegans TaxID=80388 RepID=A0A8K0WPB9_9HYPO|nr:hypothetical protein B0I35DRAFT_410608 [Stachybotrys elegans]